MGKNGSLMLDDVMGSGVGVARAHSVVVPTRLGGSEADK